ncbi:hypothetical protein L3X38_012776 [Prunus dulcis]|uniref:Uncharacterized protein n=1 Tax=Prunus dulcis TaxID=3755 RepID=A0AAD4WLL7_PRUDU|nr:hypothetical protein L3X38_012776 [Prunus dulcis]
MAKKTDQSEKKKSNDPVKFSKQWCIYRIPSRLRNVKDEAYTPQMISIGPFHHGNLKLRDMESHKKKFYENFCQRTLRKNEELENFIREKEDDILRCYAGAFELDIDFVKLPYPLLQELYNFANPTYTSSNSGKNVQEKEVADDLQHCLPCFPFSHSTPSDDHPIETEKTEPAYGHPFLKLTCEFFKEYTKLQPIENGVQVECIIRNVMALEQLMYPKKAYVCSYFLMLDQLVDTVVDVNVLIESEVIVNLLGNQWRTY